MMSKVGVLEEFLADFMDLHSRKNELFPLIERHNQMRRKVAARKGPRRGKAEQEERFWEGEESGIFQRCLEVAKHDELPKERR